MKHNHKIENCPKCEKRLTWINKTDVKCYWCGYEENSTTKSTTRVGQQKPKELDWVLKEKK